MTWMKRIVCMLVCAALCLSFAPVGAFAQETAAAGKTELSVLAAQYGSDSADWWTQFEADFEAAHSSVDLIVDVCDWGSIYDVVNERVGSGNAPDILNIDGYANYLDQLLPVQSYMSEETYNKFYSAMLAQADVDGTVYAVPDLASARGLFYNADILGEIDLAVPTTWAELNQACTAIAEAYGSDVIPWGLDISTNEAFAAFAMYTWSVGGGFLDAEGNWAINSEPNKEVMYYAIQLYNNGWANGTDLTRYDLQDQFAAGYVAMTIAPYGFMSQLNDVPGMNYGVANLIGNGRLAPSSIGVMDWFMCFDNDYSDEELAAVTAFFDFFYEDQRYADWTAMEGFLPATRTGMDCLVEEDPGMAVWDDILENVRFYPTHMADWRTARDGIADVFEQALQGEDMGMLLDNLQAQLDPGSTPVGGTCGENLTWTLENGVLTISGTGAMYDYADGEDTPWYSYHDDITTVVIEEGVTTVGDYAFWCYFNLTEVQLPSTLTSIGTMGFAASLALESITLPEGLITIGEDAFVESQNLKELVIPSSVSEICDWAFAACIGVTQITFLGDAPAIGTDAFGVIEATVYYPAGNATWTADVMQNYGGTLTWTPYGEPVIEEIASGWSGTTQWTLTSDGVLTVYGSGNMKNYGYNRNQPWLAYADRIKSIVIEEGVAAIGTGAFMDLTKLESITLPETGLKTIGEAAFYGCSSLKAIDIPDTVYTVFDYTFKGCTALEEVNFSKILIKIGQGAFENCTSLDYVYIPTKVDIIGSWSFKGCTGLTEVDMTWADATKIREGAFKNCSALTTIHLPTNIQTLGDSCFYGIGATSFTVPATVTKIEAWCFARAYSLKSITFQGDAPSIGEGAFNKITLTAYYDGGNTTWTSAIMQNYGGTITWKAN